MLPSQYIFQLVSTEYIKSTKTTIPLPAALFWVFWAQAFEEPSAVAVGSRPSCCWGQSSLSTETHTNIFLTTWVLDECCFVTYIFISWWSKVPPSRSAKLLALPEP